MRCFRLLRGPTAALSPTEWSFPVRTLVGPTSRGDIPAVLAEGGCKRPMVVTDKGLASQEFFQAFLEDLRRSDMQIALFSEVNPNPLDTDVQRGVEHYKASGSDSIICVGGGSALDGGKCIAMVAESGLSLEAMDYWSASPDLPSGGRLVQCITMPTTAGTGAEMNSGSMYTDSRQKIKRCAGHTGLPLVAVLDAEVTLGLPKTLTAWTGADALVHAIEAFFVPTYHPMCDGIALQALQKIAVNLPRAVANGSDLAARSEMLVASALAGVSFQKGLGAVHGLSEPIGAVYDSHHGLTNGILLPYVLRELGTATDDRCAEICRALGLTSALQGQAPSTTLVDWTEDFLLRQLQLPAKLGELIELSSDSAVEELALKAESNPTGFTNFRRFSAADYARVIRKAL
eukprot:TRINITY_DN10307_c0_g1_i1.p1 TRINITY_DN10307_c0_g1~~TRINITY_DN10307_c0_g1_i1.p1  ORF type:complete len:402 (-),score=65.95 TRINITY_DN10307_c0_g1_i1:213-1418(-)